VDDLHEYAFDVTLLAAIRVKAKSLKEARELLNEHLQCADSNFGAWPDGTPITAEATIEGEADLYEIDGEST
jgi:hypothetical protein